MADKLTFDSQVPPLLKFQDALSGPAGEYSDAYQNIVRQYRDDIASGTALRQQQSGTPPLPVVGQIHKSGNDIVRVDPYTGAATLSYRAPAIPQRTQNPYVDPRELQNMRATSARDMEVLRAARDAVKTTQSKFQKLSDAPSADSQELMAAGLDAKDAQDRLDELISAPPVPTAPPINQQPGLQPPPYRPAPMITPGETLPAGTVYQGGMNTPVRLQAPTLVAGNRLDAPPSTTQTDEVIRTLKDGRKAVFDSSTKKFLRYAQ